MIERLVEQIEARFAELSEQLGDPEVISDQRRYAEVGRAYRTLEPANLLAQEWRRSTDDAAGARELLAEDGDDPELRELLGQSEARLDELEEEIRLAMVEPDPNDDKDVIVEIRPGAGGEEAGLFAGDLYRMLTRYAERRGFKHESIELGEGHFTFAVKGAGAYSVFKFEGGTHRVQRVPETESQGRIHTSTATVAVLPEAEDVDVQSTRTTSRSTSTAPRGPGGQSVNTTDSAVRITHKPTGLVVSMQDEKSQLQNREKAMRVLRARLLEREMAAQQAEQAAARLAQVGSGERAEKIRTYNFPQDRVTDHRVGLTKGNLPGVLAGELDEFTAALEAEEKRRALEAARAGGRRMTVRDALDAAVTAIDAAGCCTPRLDAELLIADALGVEREALVLDPDMEIPPAAARVIGERVRRRIQREPVAYILGRKGFRYIELAVDRRTLIPRPETELLVDVALDLPEGAQRARRRNGLRLDRARPARRASGPPRDGVRALSRGRAGGARERRQARPAARGVGGRRAPRGRLRPRGGQPALRPRGRLGRHAAGDRALRAARGVRVRTRRPRRDQAADRRRALGHARRARARRGPGRRGARVARGSPSRARTWRTGSASRSAAFP